MVRAWQTQNFSVCLRMAPKRKASARTASKTQPPKSKISKVIKEEPEIEEKENNNEEFESDEDLCAYEKIRLQNIAMRQNKFDELNLSNLVSEASASAQKKTPARRGLAAEKKEKLPLEPVRKSLRLQNIDADTGWFEYDFCAVRNLRLQCIFLLDYYRTHTS